MKTFVIAAAIVATFVTSAFAQRAMAPQSYNYDRAVNGSLASTPGENN